jgi:hypothetical protein
MRTIWEFFDDSFTLAEDTTFNARNIGGKKYSELKKDAKDYFNSYMLTIAVITNSLHSEIRDLFARLQKGMGLNQAELRRALSTNIGIFVESIVNNHKFFRNCGFPDARFKHQDYIDHAIAYLVNGFKNDFKGQILKDVYVNVSPARASELIKDVSNVLDSMDKINEFAIGMFKNKWAFVDCFILIYQNMVENKKVMSKEFATAFIAF